jgi:hypothetical protein
MKVSKSHIELKNYKLLLVQLIAGLAERLEETGLKPNSKRQRLNEELLDVSAKLYREFRRDTTLAHSADVKEQLFVDMYKDQTIPRWILTTVIEILCDEQYQLVHKRSA